MSRHVGLSYLSKPEPLLRVVGGVSVGLKMKHKSASSGKRKTRTESVSEPELEAASSRPEPDVDDPPMSTSESDDSGDESKTRADIKPTVFGSKSDQSSGTVASKDGKGHGTSESSRRKSSRSSARFIRPPEYHSEPEDVDDGDEDARASKRVKTGQSGDSTPFGSQHSIGSSQRTMDRKKYGGGSQKSMNKSRLPAKGQNKVATKDIRVPKKRGRPKTPDIPRPRFSMPSVEGLETPSKQGSEFVSVEACTSSPISPKKDYQAAAVMLGSSPLKPRSVFQYAQALSDDENAKISSAALSDSSELSDIDSMPDPSVDVCPMCEAPVDPDLAEDMPTKYMSIADQRRFCHRHKVRDSKALWKKNGYPDIDWDRLEERFEEHAGHLGRVLDGNTTSHFRDVLSSTVQSGKGRTLRTSQASLTPGYYGFRGLRAMTEYLIRRFSEELRECAIKDRLVAARGHTTFVQSVLVPELAVQLVMEDLNIEAGAARDVLQESAKLGELLHEEINDFVPHLNPDP